MRLIAKLLFWIAILLILLGILTVLMITFGSSGVSSSEAVSWAIGLGFFFGLPLLLFCGFLILMSFVLKTAAADPSELVAEPHETGPRARTRPNVLVMVLRGLAIVIFGIEFLPVVFETLMFTSGSTTMLGRPIDMSLSEIAIILLGTFVWAAAIPLILWLMSNIIAKRGRTPKFATT